MRNSRLLVGRGRLSHRQFPLQLLLSDLQRKRGIALQIHGFPVGGEFRAVPGDRSVQLAERLQDVDGALWPVQAGSEGQVRLRRADSGSGGPHEAQRNRQPAWDRQKRRPGRLRQRRALLQDERQNLRRHRTAVRRREKPEGERRHGNTGHIEANLEPLRRGRHRAHRQHHQRQIQIQQRIGIQVAEAR